MKLHRCSDGAPRPWTGVGRSQREQDIGKEDGESTVKEEYRRKEGRVVGKVVEMAKEWKEKEETQGEKSGGRKLQWGGERREGSGHSPVYVFLLKCLPMLVL